MNRKIPPWQIFQKAVWYLWEKRWFALQIGWPLVVLSLLYGLAIDAGYLSNSAALQPGSAAESQVAWSWSALAAGAAVIAVQMFLLAIIAVFWHRSILLGETTSAAVPFRFDRVLWRYVGYAILVTLFIGLVWIGIGSFVGIAVGVMGAISGSQAGSQPIVAIVATPIAIVGIPLVLVVLFRVSLVLPAAAIDRHGFGLRAAWHLTRGNSWRILALQLMTIPLALVIAFAGALIGRLATTILGAPPIWASLAGNTALNFIYVVITIGLLSLTYAYLAYDLPEPDAEMR